MKIKKTSLIGNIIFGLLLISATILFMQTNINPYITKTIASSLFFLCGIFNLILVITLKNFKIYTIFMLLGLLFAMLGDIVLIDNFIIGAILFAVGHIFFTIYFCFLSKFTWIDLIIFIFLTAFALIIILLYPNFEFSGMRPLIVVYAIIISAMLSKAFGNLLQKKSIANAITLLGAFLFFFSDLMLLFYLFGGKILIFDYLCVYTYYPAEFLLALSILLTNMPKTKLAA